jgi:hypothetical protein
MPIFMTSSSFSSPMPIRAERPAAAPGYRRQKGNLIPRLEYSIPLRGLPVDHDGAGPHHPIEGLPEAGRQLAQQITDVARFDLDPRGSGYLAEHGEQHDLHLGGPREQGQGTVHSASLAP